MLVLVVFLNSFTSYFSSFACCSVSVLIHLLVQNSCCPLGIFNFVTVVLMLFHISHSFPSLSKCFIINLGHNLPSSSRLLIINLGHNLPSSRRHLFTILATLTTFCSKSLEKQLIGVLCKHHHIICKISVKIFILMDNKIKIT